MSQDAANPASGNSTPPPLADPPAIGNEQNPAESASHGTTESEELRWLRKPELHSPVLIVAFEGWNDAGDAATSAVEHLEQVWAADPVVSIDSERFFAFTETRPFVELTPSGERHIRWPANDISAGTIAGSTRHALLLRGVEPQLRWRTFSETIVEVATALGATTVVTLGALLADVPHTRPTPIFGTSDDPEVNASHRFKRSTYEGPTGIVGIVNAACSAAGLTSASIWAAVPSYVAGASSPKATLALLEKLGELLDVGIAIDRLAGDSASYERQVTAYVEQDPETASYVEELEQTFDESEDPSVDGLVDEVEQFLRDQE